MAAAAILLRGSRLVKTEPHRICDHCLGRSVLFDYCQRTGGRFNHYMPMSLTIINPHHKTDNEVTDTTMMGFYAVDVFTNKKYSGNQLAVVLVNGVAPSDERMRLIAAEINFSETVFVNTIQRNHGGYDVRIFTPAREISFAGHPILGTAWIIRKYAAPRVTSEIRLNLPVGQIFVNFEASADGDEVAWFRAPAVRLGGTCSREFMARILGLPAHDIETASPVQEITCGISAMIVPLRNLSALKRSILDLNTFAALAAQGFPPYVYLYCRETHDPKNDLCARFFFDAHGVREDPATGNGAAFLGAYLLEHRVFGKSLLSLRIEQGHEVRRPSLVQLRARVCDDMYEISVGGQVVLTMRGDLL